MTDPVQKARNALHAAEDRVRLLTNQISAECYQARKAIEDRHASNLSALKDQVWEAKAALRVAETEAAKDHEWEGKTVVKTTPVVDRWSGRPNGRVIVERGVVRTYRPGVELPQSRNNYVSIGEVLVFFLKKDGKPGKQYEYLAQPEYRAQWKLEDGQ